MNDELEVTLKEYEALRAEILDRTNRQYNTVFWSLTLLIATFGTEKFRDEFVWIIPFGFAFFGFVWLENSSTIIMLGTYIRVEIEDKLKKKPDSNKAMLNWENYLKIHRRDKRGVIHSFNFWHIIYFNSVIFAAIAFEEYIAFNKSPVNKLYFFIILVNNLILVLSISFSYQKFKKQKAVSLIHVT